MTSVTFQYSFATHQVCFTCAKYLGGYTSHFIVPK